MAVSRMRKLQILAHGSAKDDVVAALREGGVLHITEPSIECAHESRAEERRDRERDLATKLGKLEHVRSFLKPYVPKGKPLENMFKAKLVLTEDELRETVAGFDVEEWYQRCVDLEGRMRSADAEIGRKKSLALELSHWAGLGASVEDVRDTDRVRIALLNVDAANASDLESDMREAAPESDLREISRVGSSVYAVTFFLKDAEPTVTPILKRHNARWVDLAGASGRPEEATGRLRDEAAERTEDIERLKEEAAEIAREYDRVLVVLDEFAERLAKATAEEQFGSTRETFLVEGWIRGRDEESLHERLQAISSELEIASRDAEEGEHVPIDLANKPLVRPFEFVTTLYGRPIYWEFDPTPLLAPFFVLFFGLCVSDGGYGLILAFLAFLMMRKMQPGGGKQLMQLLLMGGIATAIVGALTGGWFGIDSGSLPPWLDVLRLRLRSGELAGQFFNPLEHPMIMLDFVFLLGIVQIFTGLAVRMVAEFKEGRWVDGVLDQFVWIVFLTFLVPLGADFILGKDLPGGIMSIAQTGAMVTGLVVVATGARKNPKPVMKVLGGVLKLYDIVGYFGDVLSYARLLALGLATGAIAMAINGVAEMAGALPVVGIVAAIAVLIGGHVFNLAVNCLGGFVHSARLQYLEYFSKFFQGGGYEFVPFKHERRYSAIRD